MPSDLEPRPTDIAVTDGTVERPFIGGVLAATIAATGLPTDRCQRVVAQIRGQLNRDGVSTIGQEELADLTASTIQRFHGDDLAERYRIWRAVRRSQHPVLIWIAGTSGVGKSELATRLAVRLGIDRVLSTGTIVDVLRAMAPEGTEPLHEHLFGSVDPSADDPLAAFLPQARTIAAATNAVAERLAARGESAIIEGPHLLPSDPPLAGHADVLSCGLLLHADDERWHRQQLEERPHRETGLTDDRSPRNFERIRLVQRHLVETADRAGITRLDAQHPGPLTASIVDQLGAQLPGAE